MDMVRRKWRTGHHANCKWTCVRQKNPTWGTCVFTNKLRVADKQLFVGSKSIVLETCYGYCSCFDQTVAIQFLVLRRLRQQLIMGSVESSNVSVEYLVFCKSHCDSSWSLQQQFMCCVITCLSKVSHPRNIWWQRLRIFNFSNKFQHSVVWIEHWAETQSNFSVDFCMFWV